MIEKTQEARHKHQPKGNGPTVCAFGRPRSANLVSCPHAYASNLFLVMFLPLKRTSTLSTCRHRPLPKCMPWALSQRPPSSGNARHGPRKSCSTAPQGNTSSIDTATPPFLPAPIKSQPDVRKDSAIHSYNAFPRKTPGGYSSPVANMVGGSGQPMGPLRTPTHPHNNKPPHLHQPPTC